jgi:hypothetical protein
MFRLKDYHNPVPDDLMVDKSKFDALLGKMLKADPLAYKDLLKEPKLRKDGKRKKSGKSVRKVDK